MVVGMVEGEEGVGGESNLHISCFPTGLLNLEGKRRALIVSRSPNQFVCGTIFFFCQLLQWFNFKVHSCVEKSITFESN